MVIPEADVAMQGDRVEMESAEAANAELQRLIRAARAVESREGTGSGMVGVTEPPLGGLASTDKRLTDDASERNGTDDANGKADATANQNGYGEVLRLREELIKRAEAMGRAQAGMRWMIPPARGPEFIGFNGNAPKAKRFDEMIDLTPPASYMDRFAVHNEANHERVLEVRIGNQEGDDFMFVRVNTHGRASELSSGLYHCGVRTESSHGYTSGVDERGPLLLRCGLKFDGQCFKLDMRLQTDCPQRKTLVYGSGVFEYPGLGPRAWVSVREEELSRPARGSG
ncbi:MAG: hypothetical protein AAGD22_16670 [Verrucomicrobiota bacterium]